MLTKRLNKCPIIYIFYISSDSCVLNVKHSVGPQTEPNITHVFRIWSLSGK